jgi:gliding motility-associated-like protein
MTNFILNYKKISILWVLFLLTLLSSTQAQTTYLEGHFRNLSDDLVAYPDNNRRHITHLLDGGFIIANINNEGSIVLAQRYDTFGGKVGNEVEVNSPSHTWPWSPYLNTLKNGNVLVGWDGSDSISGLGGYNPYAQILEIPENGPPLKFGDTFINNTFRNGNQLETSHAELENGDLVFSWLSQGDDNIMARVFDKDGNPRSDEFVVNEANHLNINNTSQDDFSNVASIPGGGFVVTWYSQQPGSQTDVFAKVYRSFAEGYVPLTADFQVNPSGELGNQENPVAHTFKDGFFILYENYALPKGASLRKFNLDGTPISDASRINPNDNSVHLHAHVSELENGEFIIVGNGVLTNNNIYGQLMDQDLNPVGNAFRLNTDPNTSIKDFSPSVAGLKNANGGFAVSWSNTTTNNIHYKVFHQDLTAFEDQWTPLDLSNISIKNDSNPDEISVTLTVNNGKLRAANGGGVTVINTDIASISLTGSPIDLTAFIQSNIIEYLGSQNLFGDNVDVLLFNSTLSEDESYLGSFYIDIEARPDPAVIAGNDRGSVTEDLNVNADGHLEDGGILTISDPDSPSEEFFAAGIYNGAFGQLELAANGTWTYTIDNSLEIVQNLNFGQSFIDNVIVRSLDGTQKIITITINGENELELETGASHHTVECSESNTVQLNNWLISIGNTGSATNACGEIIWTNNYNGQFDDHAAHGSALVTFTATDRCGNTVTTSATFTIQDTTPPTISCPVDSIMVSSDEGTCGASLTLEVPETADICGVKEIFNDAPETFPLGDTTVIWTVSDTSGNITTCEQIIIVEDNELPLIACPEPITLSTDQGSCEATFVLLSPELSDNCNVEIVADNAPETFPLGDTILVWNAIDGSDNQVSCEQLITVVDTEVPIVNITTGFVLQLDENGQATLSPQDIDNGSSDNCEIATLSIDLTSFDCSNLGENTVTLTVTDQSGNESVATTNIMVVDHIAPTISCLADLSVNADTGSCEAIPTLKIPETADNCEVATITNDAPDKFSVGETTVIWTVTDTSGNTATCEQVITVADNEAPIANIVAPFTLQLDDTGNATITVQDINNQSTDNCGIAHVLINKETFDCNDLGGNIIILQVTDDSGNETINTTTVTIEDNTAPQVSTQNVSIELDSSGNPEISVDDIDNGSYDNCGIASMSLDFTSFNCPTLGGTEVILTATDHAGNTSSESATVWFTAPDQDGDDIADVCDEDIDGDGIANDRDNCVTTANPSQADLDRNGVGDVCDNAGLDIPKGFSPNGDGINDTFVIGGLYSYPYNSIKIYNRWGNLVYETQNYQNDWNGVAFNKSKTLPAAPYFCVINLGDSSEIIKCWVYINY